MRKAIISVLLAGCALTTPALSQQTPPTQTKTYVYEFIHLRARVEEGLRGWLFLEDVQGQGFSHVQGFLKDIHPGDMIFDCSRDTNGLGDNVDVIQVGPSRSKRAGTSPRCGKSWTTSAGSRRATSAGKECTWRQNGPFFFPELGVDCATRGGIGYAVNGTGRGQRNSQAELAYFGLSRQRFQRSRSRKPQPDSCS